MNSVVLILIVLELDLGLELILGLDLDLGFLVEFKGLELDLEFGGLDLNRS